MSFTLRNARVGDVFTATVTEVVSPNEMIVSFDGTLLRVVDRTSRLAKLNAKVQLIVVRVKPLSFKLANRSKDGRFSVTV
ncbi:MAG: hypothetical protein CL677_05075 [Bdellovibrionaceae bacterium]|nr:hypothetical protein [Pseudobdellovibrionaceae bacterium]|tara:strand:+ start:99697 stop:99936 length:240 start_codon:yes stop_codon:yes gene_type:complete